MQQIAAGGLKCVMSQPSLFVYLFMYIFMRSHIGSSFM